ncbi:MAG: DEAD/DEAH box helicase [Bacteroidia bacterium]
MNTPRGFSRYELDERVLAAVGKLSFRRPTQVQEKVIPLFIQKRNMIVEAPTGTGKTAAYGLPLISRLDLTKGHTQALIMVPSRELAIQVAKNLESYYEGHLLKIGAVYGGVPMEESFEAIKSTPHILIVVPGRLRDVMAHYQYDYIWRDIKFLIIDEGDKLMEMGFLKDFDAIREYVRTRVQVGFFSATISEDAEMLIRERFPQIQTLRLDPKDVLKNISFHKINVKKGRRAGYLAGLISQEKVSQALIFCSRRQEIHTVVGFMRNLGLKAEAYYGNQEQNERDNILQRFKEGHIDYLVASDLAARGLDIPDLPAVINLSLPKEYDFYLHRVGRTGRAGNKGKVFNLISGDSDKIRLNNHHRSIGLAARTLEVEPATKSDHDFEEAMKWVKVHLSRGKRDKIRKGDIVGFLVNNSDLEADEVGTITIYESYSVVDLPQKGLDSLKKQGFDLKIKNKSIKVRRFQVEEQERKAQMVHKLKKDRKRMR